MPVLLSEQDVRIVLSMRDLIDAMERAFARFSSREVAQPLRSVIEVGLQKAFVGVMPAFIPDPGALGTKVVSVFGSNTAVGLPTHLATIVLLDPMTGELLSIMDGRFITEVRTAAVSAVSVKHLARRDASRLAIIGSGVQARSHLEAIAMVRPLRDVRVWSRSLDNRTAFAREMRPRVDAPVVVAASAQDAVDGADLVVLATASREPVVRERMDRRRHARLRGGCMQAGSKRDGHGTGSPQPRVRGFTRRCARGGWRHRDSVESWRVCRKRIWRANSVKSSSEQSPAERPPAT